MPHKYTIKDLSTKLSIIIKLFGKDDLVSNNIQETTLNTWLTGGGITKKKAIILCNNIGITLEALEAGKDQFIEAIEACYSNQADKDMSKHCKSIAQMCYKETFNDAMFSIISANTLSISKKDMKRFFLDYHHYYYAYNYWNGWFDDENKLVKQKSYVLMLLIKIYAYDEQQNIIRVKFTSKTDQPSIIWSYHGVMIPTSKHLYFIFEKTEGGANDKELVFIITRQRPISNLQGIILAKLGRSDEIPVIPLPAASRIALIQIEENDVIKGEDYLFHQLKEKRIDEVDECIRNKITNVIDQDVLKGYAKPFTAG